MSTLNPLFNDPYLIKYEWEPNNSVIKKNNKLVEELNRSNDRLIKAKQILSQKFILLTKDFDEYNKDKTEQLKKLDIIRSEIKNLLITEKKIIEFIEEQIQQVQSQYIDINFLRNEIECSNNWLNDELFTSNLEKDNHEVNPGNSKKQKVNDSEDEGHQKAIEHLKISREQLEVANKNLANEQYKLEALALKIKKHREKLLESIHL